MESKFRINLNVGSSLVSIDVPIRNDGLDSIDLTVGSAGSVSQQQIVQTSPHQVPPAQSSTIHQSYQSKNDDMPSDVYQEQEEGTTHIIPVEVSEETNAILNKPSSTLEEMFLTKFADRAHLYKHICNALGKHAEFCDLTKPNLMKIKDYLISRVSPNTVNLYCSIIKTCMNIYADEGVFNCNNYAQILKCKRVPSMHVYLSEEEIHRIEAYKPMSRCENDVKIKFLIECYTGARLSDVERMTIDNVKDGYVTYISKKTNSVAKIPIHKNLERLLRAKKRKDTSRSLYNRIIKRICRACGINETTNIFYHGEQRTEPKWKFVGSHTGRRSFATNLALRNVPLQVISKMMGHTGDTKMTEKYILASIEAIDDKAMEFFK